MLSGLWMLPVFPLLGFLVLGIGGKVITRKQAAVVGCSSVGLSFLVCMVIVISFLTSPPSGYRYVQSLWTWIDTGSFKSNISFFLDPLSLVMVLVVTFVGFLIHLYSVEYMAKDEGFIRFFAYMNLFVGSMLILLLADNLLFLYLGWEGVGLCSYLLIGFWYRNSYNVRAGQKAFIVTRVGDTFMGLGMFFLFSFLGTINIQEVLLMSPERLGHGSPVVVWTAVLILGGALGKSAQLPFQTWLPDAMAGPTPVSALIHAATMVTAGVYLVARLHVLFDLAPVVKLIVGVIGALTLLLSGINAIFQTDIKRVLAYSTISQIGYMFLALGVGAWSAAVYHFFTHAFFKALLFLAAGVVIHSIGGEQDMRKMGGLFQKLPITFWTFTIGSLALSAVPLVSSGFFSKDLILSEVWSSVSGSRILWLAGGIGAFLTALYTFRMLFMVFFGSLKSVVSHPPRKILTVPLVVLAFFTIAVEVLEIPHFLGGHPVFTSFLEMVLPAVSRATTGISAEVYLMLVSSILVLIGVYVAYRMYYLRKESLEVVAVKEVRFLRVSNFLRNGWGFDRVYDMLFVRPIQWLAHTNKNDIIDRFYDLVGAVAFRLHWELSNTQVGRLRVYAVVIVLGVILAVGFMVFS